MCPLVEFTRTFLQYSWDPKGTKELKSVKTPKTPKDTRDISKTLTKGGKRSPQEIFTTNQVFQSFSTQIHINWVSQKRSNTEFSFKWAQNVRALRHFAQVKVNLLRKESSLGIQEVPQKLLKYISSMQSKILKHTKE